VCLEVLGDLEDEVLVNSDVRRVASLGNSAVRVLSTVGVNLVGAVVLLVGLALIAGEIGTDLGTRTDTVSDLVLGDLRADLDNAANDLVSDAQGKRDLLAPTTSDGVDV
jgi:hypothetical protein